MNLIERTNFALLISRMVFAFGVSFELRAIIINVAQIAGAVALGFVIEMR